jgi:hypothetical protein
MHRSKIVTSFYHLVGGEQQFLWDGETQRLGGPEIDDEIELDRHLNRKLRWLCAIENAIDIGGGATNYIFKVGSV